MTLFAFACRHAANFKETYEKILKRREILFIRWEGMSIFCGGNVYLPRRDDFSFRDPNSDRGSYVLNFVSVSCRSQTLDDFS